MLYSLIEKLEIINQIRDLEKLYGKVPLTNVDLSELCLDKIDVVGVGVLVYRCNRNVVLLRRKETPDEWITPGGGVDPGESLIEGAKREVFEETGLKVEIDGVIRIVWVPNYSPEAFWEANERRFGKKNIGLLLVNFRGYEVGGRIDVSKDPSKTILEAREFKIIPFDKISSSYKVLFVQEGIWNGSPENYPLFLD
jgi:8-oxo-dGTP pyrophosphatase MutT (NUDIX family)